MTKSSTVASRRGRKRAALACQSCHKRKVRCNVTQSGPPCINCLGDGVKCDIIPRGRSRGRNNLVRILDRRQNSDAPTHDPVQQSPHLNQSPPASESISVTPEPNSLDASAAATSWSPKSGSTIDSRSVRVSHRDHVHEDLDSGKTRLDVPSEQKSGINPEDSSAGFCAILDEADVNEETICIYTGDPQGLGFVVDICQPHRQSRGNHFMIPRAATNSALLPADLAALHAKTCFTLPPEKVCKRLLQCYFQHIHHFLPILEAGTFITQYESGGPQQVNLLLLWTIFFAATNCIDHETMTLAGYSSRKTMKRSLYQRAKALYDAGYEKDRVPLIQSVLLMSFWYADSDDRDGAWHWSGIAISLCQTIGLHRNPGQEQATFGNGYGWKRRGVPEEKLRLWRLIWWMCYLRDTWLSFGLGRPPRINLVDCDMPMPTISDVQALTSGLLPQHAKEYLPDDEHGALPLLWSCLFDTTLGLGNILTNHYRPQPPADGRSIESIIDQDRKRLMQCRAKFPSEERCESLIVLSHLYHLQIYYESCQIALNRPYMAGKPGRPTGTLEETWKTQALQRAKIAASNIDGLLSKMAASNMMSTSQSTMVTAMIPALQIHLLEFVSPDPLANRLGRHRLDILMIFLRQLQSTYWAADFIYDLFQRAIDVLDSQNTQVHKRSSSSLGCTGPAEPSQTKASDRTMTGDRLQTPARLPSQPNEELETGAECSLATPSSTIMTSTDTGRPDHGNSSLQLPNDMELTLAYDILPFQFDVRTWTASLGTLDPNPLFLDKQPDASLNFYLSDRDLNQLFDADQSINLPPGD